MKKSIFIQAFIPVRIWVLFQIKNIKCNQLPQNAKEGSVLVYKNNKFELDIEKEQQISKTIEKKMNDLWEE